MNKRHRKIHSHEPAYNYVFPQDELKAQLDCITVGSIRALQDFPRVPTPCKEEIELDVLVHCERMKTTIGAEKLTNDYGHYVKIAKQAYTEAYIHNLKRYVNNAEAYEAEKKVLDELGREKYYTALRDATIGVLIAGRA
jgi:hypothetical protein